MRILTCGAAAILCVVATPVLAQVQAVQAPTEAPPHILISSTPAQPNASKPQTGLIDEAELAVLNGRQGSTQVSVLSEQDLVAVNQGNTINAGSVGSGQISIDRGAFEGFAGIGNFVINSGHNNNLQGAITINIVQP